MSEEKLERPVAQAARLVVGLIAELVVEPTRLSFL